MSSRTLAIATMAAALLWGCSAGEPDADRGIGDDSSVSPSTGEAGETAASGSLDGGGDPDAKSGLARGWSAEIAGGGDLDLPAAGGPAVLVSRTPAGTTLTGMTGEGGGSLTIGLETFEPGENTAHDFNLGFQLQRYRCIGERVVVTLTQVEPKLKGTFSGPVRCEDLSGTAQSFDATVSGQIAG